MLSYFGLAPVTMLLLCMLMLWDSIWKAIGLWRSGRHKQLGWFVCIFIFNTLGLLPIIYLLFFQKKHERRRARRKRR